MNARKITQQNSGIIKRGKCNRSYLISVVAIRSGTIVAEDKHFNNDEFYFGAINGLHFLISAVGYDGSNTAEGRS